MKRIAFFFVFLILAAFFAAGDGQAERVLTVKLVSSNGLTGIQYGTVQFWLSGKWRAMGITDENGEVDIQWPYKPGKYKFQVDYKGSMRKTVYVSSQFGNPIVVFETREVVVRVLNTRGRAVQGQLVQYRIDDDKGEWRDLGITGPSGNVYLDVMGSHKSEFRIASAPRVYQKIDTTRELVVELVDP